MSGTLPSYEVLSQRNVIIFMAFCANTCNKPEAHGPQCSPECTGMKAIFSQNTVKVACKKI